MHQRTFLHVLRRRAALMAVAGLLGMVCAGVWWSVKPASYHSSATVHFTAHQGATGTELHQISVFAKESASTYALLATTPSVLERVITQLDLKISSEELARSIDTSVPIDSALVDISVTAATPEAARQRTEAVATSLITTVSTLPPRARDGKAALTGTLHRPATSARGPSSIKGAVLVLGCGVLAAAAVAAAVCFRQVLNPVLISGTDLKRLTQAPLWGGYDARLGTLAEAAAPASAWATHHRGASLLWCGVHDDDLTPVVVATVDALNISGTSTELFILETEGTAVDYPASAAPLPHDISPATLQTRVDKCDSDLVIVLAPPLLPGSSTASLVQACDGVVLVATVDRAPEARIVLAHELVSTTGGQLVAALALVPSRLRQLTHAAPAPDAA